MNTYRKKNYRGKRSYSGRPHRRSVDNYHQPLPPEKESIPYARHTLTKPDVEAVVEALLSGTLTQGKELERFEALLSKLTHSDHAIAMNSGTAAVHAALACLKLEPEDEVITSTLNFCAITNMVRLVGATPVLVDCDPDTLTLSVEAARAAVTPNTKAIFTNNFGGHASDLTALRELCDEHALMLIEDACHGLGGKYRGHYVGNQADITCFSFHPSKAITTCEGGAVTTNNRAIAEWIRVFRQHGIQKDKRHFTTGDNMPGFHQELQFPGMNYRMSELHAALGRSQLTRLDRHIERRRSIAQVYFQKLGNVEALKLPFVAEWADSAYHLFPIQFVGALEDKRDQIYQELRDNNIEAQLHYIPVHRMPLYANRLGKPEQFPNAEAYYGRAISMPLFPDLSYKEIERITELLLKIIGKFLNTEEAEAQGNTADSSDNTAADAADNGSEDVQESLFEDSEYGDGETDDDGDDDGFDNGFDQDEGEEDGDESGSEEEAPEDSAADAASQAPESGLDNAEPEQNDDGQAPEATATENEAAQPEEPPVKEEPKPARPPALSLTDAPATDAPAETPEPDAAEAVPEKAAAKPKSTTRRTRAGRTKKDSAEGDGEAAPKKTRTTSRRTTRAKKSSTDDDKTAEAKSSTGRLRKVPKSDEEEGETPKPKRTTRTRSRKAVQNSEEGEKTTTRKRTTRTRKSTKAASDSDAETSSTPPPSGGDEASE